LVAVKRKGNEKVTRRKRNLQALRKKEKSALLKDY
jgi:hypothetical protein